MIESKVIAQFQIDREFLLNRNNELRNFMENDRVRRYLAKKAIVPTAHSIKDLQTGMTHINLKAKILEVTEPKHVVTKHGNQATIAKALIADETGRIRLCLWNEQISVVSAGNTVQIKNAKVSNFRGERQINLGRKGTISKVEIFKPPLTSIDLPAS